MPRFDGTGPMGEGPLTGGGRGNCNTGIGFNKGIGQGFSRGFGQGRGFGRGFGGEDLEEEEALDKGEDLEEVGFNEK